MSAVGLTSKDEFSEGKPVIHEDPNSKSHLEALFDVLNETTPPVKPSKKLPDSIPMTQRQFPDSFFNPSKFGTNVGGPAHHNRSISMPASISDTHHRQYSVDNNVQGPIPPGWEEAQTPDGISYYIDHNNKTTTWEDPRRRVPMGRAPVNSSHLHMPPYQQPSMHQALHQQNSGSNQSIDSIPLPDGWQKAYTAEGESYYVNHKNRTTSWFHPSASQHHHSHSFAGVPPRIGQQVYPGYPHPGGMGAMPPRIPYEAHRQPEVLQQQPMEVNRAANLYNDPYLSSNNHIRQASHDSGLGVTAMPYSSSDVGMEFDEGMDTGNSSVKVPLNPEYLENMPATDIDTDQQMDSNLGQWV